MGRKPKELALVDELLKNETEIVSEKPIAIDFMDEKTFIEKGRPRGVTTARIAKFRFGSPEYAATFKEYLTAAYRFSIFAKKTGYPFVDDFNWPTVKKEISEWKTVYNLTEGDLARVLAICWAHDYKKSKLGPMLKFNGVQLPKDDYQFKYVEFIQEDDEPTLEDMVRDIIEKPKKEIKDVETNCEEHPAYRGLRIPRNGCSGCMSLYEKNKASGVKEARKC